MISDRRLVLLTAGLILLIAGPVSGQPLPLEAVADTSTPVPDGAPGEVFVFFRPPSLSGNGVVFYGEGSGAQGSQRTLGVYTDVGGVLAPVADNSTPVPGGAPGEIFSSFGNLPSISSGSVAFTGSGDMGTRGVYTNLGGVLAAVADNSTPVPGGAPGEVFMFFGNGPSLSGASVAFSADGDMGTRGVYTNLGGVLTAVADNSTPVPGGAPGELFSNFGEPSLSGGSVAFFALSQNPQACQGGIYKEVGGVLAAVADDSTPVPGGAPGEVFCFLPYPFTSPSLSGASVAFWGTGDMGALGVYTDVGGVLAAVADTSTPVPGGVPGEAFWSFDWGGWGPSLSGASVSCSAEGNMGTEGVYSDVGGALGMVADISTPVPGGAPGELFAWFDSRPHSISGTSIAFSGGGDLRTSGIYLAAQSVFVTEIPTLGPIAVTLLALMLALSALAALRLSRPAP